MEFPELLGYLRLSNSSTRMDDMMPYLAHLMTCVESQSVLLARSTKIRTSVRLFCDVLEKRELTLEIDCQFNGGVLGDGVDEIELERNVSLLRFSSKEMEKMLSNDLRFSKPGSVWQGMSDALLRISSKEGFEVGKNSELLAVASKREMNVLAIRENVLRALHLLKPGRTGFLQFDHRYSPNVLPFANGFVSYPPAPVLPGTVRIELDDVETFRSIYLKLKKESRKSLVLAIQKLAESEQRDTAVDSILDCVVGLEALLRPGSQGEQSFRVALNYAFLFPKELRRLKFDLISQAQVLRNDLIHGSASARELGELGAIAETTKESLREVAMLALFDPNFGGDKKSSKDYWLDRIFNAKI